MSAALTFGELDSTGAQTGAIAAAGATIVSPLFHMTEKLGDSLVAIRVGTAELAVPGC
ncbi:MAG: hypothetical protein ABI810_21325 [Sphingomonas bacterium]